jgi:hypothetical protein
MYAIYMLKVVKDTEDNAYTTQNKYDMRVWSAKTKKFNKIFMIILCLILKLSMRLNKLKVERLDNLCPRNQKILRPSVGFAIIRV